MAMTREEMIELLIPVLVSSGESLVTARRRLWRMSTSALERELLLRELAEYNDPPPDDDVNSDDGASPYSALGWSCAPVYLD
jgi:hypothetical protein